MAHEHTKKVCTQIWKNNEETVGVGGIMGTGGIGVLNNYGK